mmetsp:Transcript_22554/g.33085  ORF Transcript_22554/g.33085 Transcript_22554/m.33085 type:complete len:93 (-) Transcript_22554:784-1062(-)
MEEQCSFTFRLVLSHEHILNLVDRDGRIYTPEQEIMHAIRAIHVRVRETKYIREKAEKAKDVCDSGSELRQYAVLLQELHQIKRRKNTKKLV